MHAPRRERGSTNIPRSDPAHGHLLGAKTTRGVFVIYLDRDERVARARDPTDDVGDDEASAQLALGLA
jgi:hypothetical protein